MLKKLFNDLRNASICPALEVPVEVRTHIANECLALATELRTCQPNEATGQPNFEKSIERAVEMLGFRYRRLRSTASVAVEVAAAVVPAEQEADLIAEESRNTDASG